ncbi:MAG TPA: M1 family metallopeptidase, partial [Bacteroidia bacterium]|nr:M1 family metallopeptidase [Bacteroidia bacterium]
MIRKLLLVLLLFCGTISIAQVNENAYASKSNALYWKNRPPYEGYWQQDVQYNINATLDDQTDIITGDEDLNYFNNSPDTLAFVYFHLYQNAFQPGSYTDDLHRNNDFLVRYGRYESQKLGTQILSITEDNFTPKTETDNTIMKVWLHKPLLPGGHVSFRISFKTYFDDGGNIRRRMKMYKTFGYKHYDGVHWYPRMAVYDRKFGWCTDQHLTREFYGDFGTYDVQLTLPNNYILDGTGVMLNENEMLPPDLRRKLDISNFATKPWNSAPSQVIAPDGTTKTWKFHADNVHDFAFTADPLYRIGEVDWNGVRCIALAQEQHCAGWVSAAAYTARVIEVYSKDFGMYAYPKMIVADAQDGMEYPMLTLDGGYDPNYRSLIAHEVGHNWFFGMVGSNETYRALLDEGFTQFLTAYCCVKLGDKYVPHNPYISNYVGRFSDEETTMNQQVYDGYIFDAARGDETVIDNHSDHFNGALRHGGGYGQVYMKTATMLYNLQYVLGDSLFLAAMSHYFNQWKFCHPYVEDFRNSIIQFTHVDLNWFFDEWLTTSQTIDYGIKSVKKADSTDTYNVTFKRYGRMQMPIDFTVFANDGQQYSYYIPNTWYEKQTTATSLPRWIGWDKLKPTYTARIVVPSGIREIQIDTTHRLADVNMLNNSTKMPVTFVFDSKVYNTPSWEHYSLRGRPDFWYNGYDGLKVGMYLGGDYMNTFHQFNLLFHYNTGIGQSQLKPGTEINRF